MCPSCSTSTSANGAITWLIVGVIRLCLQRVTKHFVTRSPSPRRASSKRSSLSEEKQSTSKPLRFVVTGHHSRGPPPHALQLRQLRPFWQDQQRDPSRSWKSNGRKLAREHYQLPKSKTQTFCSATMAVLVLCMKDSLATVFAQYGVTFIAVLRRWTPECMCRWISFENKQSDVKGLTVFFTTWNRSIKLGTLVHQAHRYEIVA